MAEEIQLGDPVDILLGQFPDGAGHGAPGVVYQNIHLAETVQGQAEQGFNVFVQGDVRFLHHGLYAQDTRFFAHRPGGRAVNVIDDHIHAPPGAFQRNGPANAPAAAGDDENFIFKFFHDVTSS